MWPFRKKKKKLIIYGGSFNPPTIAHQHIIEQCLVDLDFKAEDEFFVVPAGPGQASYKGSSYVSSNHRENLCSLMITEVENKKGAFLTSGLRLRKEQSSGELYKKDSSTITLIDYFRNSLEFRGYDLDIYLVIGMDNVADIENWKESDRLKSEVKFVVFPREGYSETNLNKLGDNYKILGRSLKYPYTQHISSSLARELVCRDDKKGLKELKGLLSPSVLQYIRDHNLYRCQDKGGSDA
jgi:nicotinate-nucleotide adenylyltransferase